jgi:hypothetical protein
MSVRRPLAALAVVLSLVSLVGCTPAPSQRPAPASPADAQVDTPVEQGPDLLVPGLGVGRDAAEAQARAVDNALAEAARIRQVTVAATTISDAREERRTSTDATGTVTEGAASDSFVSQARTTALSGFTGTRVEGGDNSTGADGRVTCRLRVAVPLLQVYPDRHLAQARSPGELAAVAPRFEAARLTDWAVAAWLRLARHADASPGDRLDAATACERLHHRVEALRLARSEATALATRPVDDRDRQRAEALLARLSAVADSAELWRQLSGCADAARAPARFTVTPAAANGGTTLHWQIVGPARRLLTLWSDGEDIGWLRLRGGEQPFAGAAVTTITLRPGQAGTILAWALPEQDPAFALAAGLPQAGVPLAATATVDGRVQLDALRAALEAAVAAGAPALRLRVPQ